MDNIPITVTLSFEQVNRIMRLLGSHPFEQVQDVIMALKTQGDAQVIAHRKKLMEPPEDPLLSAVDEKEVLERMS